MNLKTSAVALDEVSAAQKSKLDAYLLAGIKTNFAEYALGCGTKPTLSVGFTVSVDKDHPADEIIKILKQWFDHDGGSRMTTAHLRGLADTKPAYVTADVSFDLLLKVIDARFVTEIQLCASLAPNRPVPRYVTRDDSLSEDVPIRMSGDRVLAVIDHGCPFAHRAFLDGEKTRVGVLWDQDSAPDFPKGTGSTPEGYGYGRQLDADSLNEFIQNSKIGSRIDEDLCYELAQYTPLRSRCTHGSLTLGLLAANWQSPSLSETHRLKPCDDAPDADIVFVQLPRNVIPAASRGSLERAMLDGVSYILDCAKDGAHVAVVLAYGAETGPHDGSSWFERAIDAMIFNACQRKIRLDVVFASGNSHDEGRHAVVFPGPCKAKTEGKIGLWVPKSNDAPVAVEIWTDLNNSNFEFSLKVPGVSASRIQFNAATDATLSLPAAGKPWCVVVNRTVGRQRQILIQISPTGFSGHSADAAPSGVWTLGFKMPHGRRPGSLYLYVCWGGRNPGVPQRMKPAKFFVKDEEKQVVLVDGAGSILGGGCGAQALMAGGYEKWLPMARAIYSGGGKARGGKRKNQMNGADLLAVTEESPTLPGLLCLGTRSASRVRARGTSFAAPQLARKIIFCKYGDLPPCRPAQLPGPGRVKNAIPRNEYGEPRMT